MKNTRNLSVYLLLAAILLILIVVLSSCGSDEDSGDGEQAEKCKKSSDCKFAGKDKKAFSVKCEEKECVYTAKKGVCGNGDCEKEEGETLCSCPKDCTGKDPSVPKTLKECKGKADTDGNLEYKCDKKQQCVVEIVGQKQETKIETLSFEQSRVPQAKVILKQEYPKPFNIDSDVLSFKLNLDYKILGVDEVTLKRIQVFMHTGEKVRGRWDPNDQEVPLVDKLDINRVLWDPQLEVVQELPLDAEINQSKKTTLTLKLFFTYKGKDSRGNDATFEETKTFDIEDFLLTRSTAAPECTPAKCNDNNPCTEDKCVTGKGYCDHVVFAKTCKGNFRCDEAAGENKCNAPEDCGSCKGKAGEFAEYRCSDDKKECGVVLSKEGLASVDEKRLTNEQKIPAGTPDIRFKIIKTFNSPFKAKISLTADKFTLTMQVLDKKATTKNFKVNNIELVDGTSLLGNTVVSQAFNNVGDKFDFKIPFTKPLVLVEEKRTKLKLKVTYSYEGVDRQDKPLVHTNEIFEEDIGEVLLVNAG
ncbi:TPA: hypothetical protein HA246_03535 [Candidatus Woesearchaeota archaeon]|nr:hypothetical protein [Candidatus Woesearchaeota archaeon]